MIERNTQLYMPASSSQIRDFSNRIDIIVNKADVSGDGLIDVAITRNADVGNGIVLTAGLLYAYENDETETYVVNVSHAKSIDRSIGSHVLNQLFSYDGENGYDYTNDQYGDLTDGYDLDPEDFEEGYLQHDWQLMLHRTYFGQGIPTILKAKKMAAISVLDCDGGQVDSHIISHHSIDGLTSDAEIKDLEDLYRFDEKMLDTESLEQANNTVTSADLIIALSSLQQIGIANSRIRAYRKAPQTVEGFNLFSQYGDTLF